MKTVRAPGDNFAAASLDRLGDVRPFVIRLDRRTVFFTSVSRFASRVFVVALSVRLTAIRCTQVLNCESPRYSAAEDLNPNFLGDVGGQIRIVADQTAYDHVDVRGMPRPKGTERRFIARDRSAYQQRFVIHDCWIGHEGEGKGLQGRAVDMVGPPTANELSHRYGRKRKQQRYIA
jgi:hypothetical protein